MTNARQRLKIAFVVHDYTRRIGHSRYVVELASRYRHEHDVHVFTNTVSDVDVAGLTLHHVPAWRRNALASILSFVIPATLKVRGAFDIVHAQGLCGLRHNIATAHLCQSSWFDALRRAGIRLSWRQQVFRGLVTGLERLALTQPATRRVIAVSERVKSELADVYGRSDGVEVVYHGTDTTTFHPDNRTRHRAALRANAGISSAAFVALYVGDLKKGAAAAIRAIARVPHAILLILSSSETEPYRLIAAQEGVVERVLFHPHSLHVDRYFAAADVFLFPTVYDSFGLVITEAMAAGLPVITNRMAGAAELITDGIDGLLTATPWDVPALAERIAQLRDDPAMREKIGQAARRRIEPFTWDLTAARTLAVYERIVAETR